MSNRFLKFFLFTFREHGFKVKIGLRRVSQKIAVEKPPRQVPREKPAVQQRSAGGYPLLVIPITAFGLGTWQVQRREWKLGLIAELEKKMSTPPVPLPENLEDIQNMEYCRVKVRGTFDHSRELVVGPRSDVNVVETLGKKSEQGINVVTPLKLSDRNETILVNRGFVPYRERPPQLRAEGQIEGEVEIVGVVRLSDKKSFLSNDPYKDGYWLMRNVEEMAEIADTAKVFIDADFNSTVPGGPQGGQTRVSLRNEHMSYIITWYSLAAFTFFLWYKNYRSYRPSVTVVNYMKKQQRRS